MNFKKIVIILLFSSAIISGVVLLFFGIKDSVALAIKTKDWFEAPGYFREYSVYNVNNDGEITYRLKYVYYSGGAEYFIETDYGSEVIPEIDSVRTVLYEPENPKNAVIKGGEASSLYLTLGIMFTVIPVFMIICWLFFIGKINLPVKSLDFAVGFIMFMVAELFLYIMSGSFLPHSAFKSSGFLAVIPTLMSAVGVLQMVKTVFAGKKEKK